MNECTEHIIKAQQGDLAAFGRLVEQNRQYVFRLAMRLMMDQEQAADVVQETFIKVWKQLHRFQTNKRFSTWLYKITVNLCYDHLKSRQRYRRVFERENQGTMHVPANDDVHRELEDRDTLAFVQIKASELPARQRMVFVLRDLEDMEMKEIAWLLKMTVGSVKSHLYQARKTIRELCKQDEL